MKPPLDGDTRELDQRNLPERVAELLLGRIAAGRISLGSRIVEVKLSEELGVSRPTLREGLRLLEARGIVHAVPQRGTFVRRYDPGSVSSIYALRETSELRAIDLLLVRPERLPPLLARLRAVAAEMAPHEGRSNLALNRLDIAFHTALVDAAGDFALGSIWVVVKHHLAVIFALELADGTSFATDHERLADALETRDRAAIEAEYRRHVAKDRLDVA